MTSTCHRQCAQRLFLGVRTEAVLRVGNGGCVVVQPMGLKSPAIDRLIDVVLAADTRDELTGGHQGAGPRAAGRTVLGAAVVQGHPLVAYYDMYEHPDPCPPMHWASLISGGTTPTRPRRCGRGRAEVTPQAGKRRAGGRDGRLYPSRRLLLIIPTLFGIMVINFSLTQFVPGGPIEQVLARLEGGGDVFEKLRRRRRRGHGGRPRRGRGALYRRARPAARIHRRQLGTRNSASASTSRRSNGSEYIPT
jgi:hypothetical protein